MCAEASLSAESYNKTGIPEVIYNPYAWTKVRGHLIR